MAASGKLVLGEYPEENGLDGETRDDQMGLLCGLRSFAIIFPLLLGLFSLTEPRWQCRSKVLPIAFKRFRRG